MPKLTNKITEKIILIVASVIIVFQFIAISKEIREIRRISRHNKSVVKQIDMLLKTQEVYGAKTN